MDEDEGDGDGDDHDDRDDRDDHDHGFAVGLMMVSWWPYSGVMIVLGILNGFVIECQLRIHCSEDLKWPSWHVGGLGASSHCEEMPRAQQEVSQGVGQTDHRSNQVKLCDMFFPKQCGYTEGYLR